MLESKKKKKTTSFRALLLLAAIKIRKFIEIFRGAAAAVSFATVHVNGIANVNLSIYKKTLLQLRTVRLR
jgi:hypothetical protein